MEDLGLVAGYNVDFFCKYCIVIYVSTKIKPALIIEVSSPDEALVEQTYRTFFGMLNPEELDSAVSGIPLESAPTFRDYKPVLESLFNKITEKGGNFISPGFITAPAVQRHNILGDRDLDDENFWSDFCEYLAWLNSWKASGVRVVHLHVRSPERERFQLRRMAYSLIYSWQVHNPSDPEERKSAATDWVICDTETDLNSLCQRIRSMLIH
jgi:hypothetical protein